MEKFVLLAFLFHLPFDLSHGDQIHFKFKKFSTKTTYENSVAQDDLHLNSSRMEWHHEGCKPVLVVGLLRHGIRYPGENDITSIAKVIFKMKVAGVSPSVVDPLEMVANKFLLAEAKDLAVTGKQELQDLGKRFGQKLKESASWTEKSSPSDFGFFSSSKSRALGSCESFKSGFTDAAGILFDFGTNVDDSLLRFFDECSKYVVTVAENKSTTAESSKFQETFLPEINERIAARLIVNRIQLDKDEVKAILVVAATELAIFGTATWSQLLSDEDLVLLEYAADVKNYWKKSYGFPINYEPSCVLLQHMFQHLENFVTCKERKKGVFYFGHTETVLPILSLLGLFNDSEPLMADNYNRHDQRQFRTSRVSPFASNVAFVLNDCSTEATDCSAADPTSAAERFSVRLLFKERPLILPACGRLDCPYSTVREHYARRTNTCNFNEMCWFNTHEEL